MTWGNQDGLDYLLTGRRAFECKSQLSVASAILEKEPQSIVIARGLLAMLMFWGRGKRTQPQTETSPDFSG
jgi:hypothetical protein